MKSLVKSVFKRVKDRIYKDDTYHVIQLPDRYCRRQTVLLPADLSIEQVQERHIELLAANWPPSVSYLSPDRQSLLHLLKSRLDRNEIGIICLLDKKLVGMSWLSRHDLHVKIYQDNEKESIVCWKNIYVAPEHRRMGMAVANFNFALDIVNHEQADQFLAFVQLGNKKSTQFMTRTIGGTILGQLVFQNRWGQRNVYFQDIKGNLHQRNYPTSDGYVS